MPVAGPELGDAVKEMLARRGVGFHPLHKLTKVNSAAHELSFEGRDTVKYDLLVVIPPHRGPAIVREAGLTNEAGWAPVDRETLATKYENVYGLGDVTAITIPGRWKPDVPLMLPKAGVFAHAQAETVARRIAAEIKGTGAEERFPGAGYCMLEAGENLAGFAFGDFYAQPSPQIHLRQTGRTWHVGKAMFEQWWLSPFGLRRAVLQRVIAMGGKALKIPVIL